MFIYLFFISIFFFSNTFLTIIELECVCFRGRSLNFTTDLYVNFISIHIPLHTLLSFLPADHEIAHQWSGNPHSWDSIYQHQRKPQRLLVKLLTNILNTRQSIMSRALKLLVPCGNDPSCSLRRILRKQNSLSALWANQVILLCTQNLKITVYHASLRWPGL